MVCSGWLRKSPPEKKLKRYVSTGQGTAGRGSSSLLAELCHESRPPLPRSLSRPAGFGPGAVLSHPDVQLVAKLSPSILQTAFLEGLVALEGPRLKAGCRHTFLVVNSI